LARDLAQREQRQLQLRLDGTKIELDKLVVERLSDSLMHLVGNAVRHGIEPPDERTRAGKPVAGQLSISAQETADTVVIVVEDDGRGIDLDRVRQRLVETGVLAPGVRVNEQELLDAIFMPGFTTIEEGGTASGIGLDAVLRSVESLGGQLAVTTKAGTNTRFVIQFPRTMTIRQALLVKAGPDTCALPAEAVLQVLEVSRGEISTAGGGEVITLDEQVLPVLDLDALITTDLPETGGGKERTEMVPIVVMQVGDSQVGLVVDHVSGRSEIISREPDDDKLTFTWGVAGTAVLEDGTVVQILDIAELVPVAETSSGSS
jgi:two-component system chemotaxis sensor kinase CheA